MSAGDIIAVIALAAAVGALINSWWQGKRMNEAAESSNEIAEEANSIARESFALSRKKAREEDTVFVQPLRWDAASNRAVFGVSARKSVAEVEFELMDYGGAGGKVRREMVAAGEVSILHQEFTPEMGTLPVPGPREYVAKARWRQRSSDEWSIGDVYTATKDRSLFQRENRS